MSYIEPRSHHELYEVIDYRFNNEALLKEAMSHPSVTDEMGFNYERLEFLGDAVLGMVVAEMLYNYYDKEPEGLLAKKEASLVSGETIAEIATEINLSDFMFMSYGEHHSGGKDNHTNLENALEALIGAIYLDAGLEHAKQFISALWKNRITKMVKAPVDPKTELQEYEQSKALPLPKYHELATEGPSHAPTFTIEVSIVGFTATNAQGNTKRVAEREAARNMLQQIEKKQHHNE